MRALKVQQVDLMTGETKSLLYRILIGALCAPIFLLYSCNTPSEATKVASVEVFFAHKIDQENCFTLHDYEICFSKSMNNLDQLYQWEDNILLLPMSTVVVDKVGDKEFTAPVDPFNHAFLLYDALSKKNPDLVAKTTAFKLHTTGGVTIASETCFAFDKQPYGILPKNLTYCANN